MPRSLLATGFNFSQHGLHRATNIFLPGYGGLGSFLQIFHGDLTDSLPSARRILCRTSRNTLIDDPTDQATIL